MLRVSFVRSSYAWSEGGALEDFDLLTLVGENKE